MKKEILILSSEKMIYKFDDRTVNKTQIYYGIFNEKDKFKGYSILKCNVDENSYDIVSKYVGQKVNAVILEKLTDKGANYIISEINNVAI